MLSTKTLSSAGSAQQYFLEEGNYYTQEYTMTKNQSQWWGQGAEILGLQGEVKTLIFTHLLEGKLFNGQQLGVVVDGQLKHRPGFDLTFSAPKSVSILALLGGDARILQAVARATDKALFCIEQEQAKARITRNGITEAIKTGNLVVAKFMHDVSREGDPQLHTHCVVMNMTRRPDGHWRSLASQLGNYKENSSKMPEGFIEGVRHYKKYYGAIFRAELAYEMSQLGYTVERKNAQGFFEIAGISAATLQAYSERRQDIVAYLQEQGYVGAKAAAVATLQTRGSKNAIQREDLSNLWQAKSAQLTVDAFTEAKAVVSAALSVEKNQTILPADFISAQKVVQDAILHLAETSVSLRENAILHHAMQNAVGKNIAVDSIIRAVEEEKQYGRLIVLPPPVSDALATQDYSEQHFTTATLLRYEQDLLAAIDKSAVNSQPLLSTARIDQLLAERQGFSPSQRKALYTLFTHKQSIMALTGPAGSGKSHLLSTIVALGEKSGLKPIVLTPTRAETYQLQQAIQTYPKNLRQWIKQLFDQKQFSTVAGFLHQTPESTFWQNPPFLIVDKAQQLSARQMHGLLEYARQHRGHLLVVGDPQAMLSWQAGSPLAQVLKHGVVTAKLRGNYRTYNPQLQKSVAQSLQGNIAAALQHIGDRIVEVPEASERWQVMAAHYVGLSKEQRENTQVLMPTKATSEAMNLAIRAQRQASGELPKEQITIMTLQSKSLSAAQAKYAKHYQVGEWVKFHADYVSLKVRKGDYREIVGIDIKNNALLLKSFNPNQNQKSTRWDPARIAQGKVELFTTKQKQVSAGEELIWRSANSRLGFYAGQRFTVQKLQLNKLLLTDANGRAHKLDLRQLSSRHFDYGYSTTVWHKSPVTPDNIIAYQSAVSGQSHQRSFYQLLSQAKNQAWIYTENASQLVHTLQKYTGNKTTAIDALLKTTLQDNPDKSKKNSKNYLQLIEQAVAKTLQNLQKISTASEQAQAAMQYAIQHLSQREAAFGQVEVLQAALHFAIGKTYPDAIAAAVTRAAQSGALIPGIFARLMVSVGQLQRHYV